MLDLVVMVFGGGDGEDWDIGGGEVPLISMKLEKGMGGN